MSPACAFLSVRLIPKKKYVMRSMCFRRSWEKSDNRWRPTLGDEQRPVYPSKRPSIDAIAFVNLSAKELHAPVYQIIILEGPGEFATAIPCLDAAAERLIIKRSANTVPALHPLCYSK